MYICKSDMRNNFYIMYKLENFYLISKNIDILINLEIINKINKK